MNKYAVVFPGQGSQSVGMLADLANDYPIIGQTVNIVSEALGYDVWELMQKDPHQCLDQTRFTQVAMLAADVAVFNVIKALGFDDIAMMAGHSLGEYSALVCAKALSLNDAAKLVDARARCMQSAVPDGVGAMGAIVGLSDEDVQAICQDACDAIGYVAAANFNAIGQVVIAGYKNAVEWALVAAEKKGARLARLIPVSVPCHCALLEEAADEFSSVLQAVDFKKLSYPVISNVDLSIYTDAQSIRRLLKEQLFKPVRWVEIIQLMKSEGIESVIEVGPGAVLSGLIKRIDRTLRVQNTADKTSIDKLLSFKLENI